MKGQLLHQVGAVTRMILARLRFLSVFLVAGLIVGYWENIKNHWDKWTRPAVSPDSLAAAAASDIEYFCVMHTNIIRSQPGNCPICGMPLLKRKKGEKLKLPQDVLARVQLSPQRIAMAGIATSTVEQRPLVREIHALGVLDYNETKVAQLSARVAGRADKLFIEYTGQSVKEGDPVYSLYSPELYASQREYLLARQRVNQLPADASAAARSDAAMIYNATMEKLVLWGVARKQLDEMDQEYDRSGKVPSHLVMTSPISGVVVRKDIFEGGYLNAGDRPYTIANLSALWLQVKLYEHDVALVEIGQPVEVTVDALPEQVFHGTVTFKAFQLDPQTRTLDARVEVGNTDLKLRPGMFADAAIHVPVATESPTTRPASAPATPAPAEEVKAYAAGLRIYLQAQELLAKDKAAGVSELLNETARELQPLAGEEPLAAAHKHLMDAARASQAQELEPLRKTFKEASNAVIELGKAVGLGADAPDVRIYRCPMTDKPYWLQVSGETANPYYGSQMLTCGGPVEALPRAEATGGGAKAATRPRPQAKAVLSIPRSAVIEAGRRRIVYVESADGVFDMRAVGLGPLAGEFYPVLYGLAEGDRVVTSGAFLIDSENRLNPMQ